jgi:hypothetical protein
LTVATHAEVFVTAARAQDLSVTVSVADADASAWAMTAYLRAYAGGAALVTLTTSGGGIVATYSAPDSSVVCTFTDTHLTLAPGLYVWELVRTTADAAYPVVDPSGFLVTTNTAGSYPTLANVSVAEAYTGLTVSDAQLPFYLLTLAAAERAIRSLCGRDATNGFLAVSRTEYPECHWTDRLYLQEAPVSSLTSVYYSTDGSTWDSTTLLTADTDYRLDLDAADGKSHAGVILGVNRIWAGGWERPNGRLASRRVPRRYAQVTYVGGYATPPEDLVIAVIEAAQQAKLSRLQGVPFQSESGEGRSYSLGDMEKDAARLLSVQHVVNKYRRGSAFVA